MVEELAGRAMAGAVRAAFVVVAVIVTLLVLNQLLNLQLFSGVVFIENRYLYLLAALLFPLVFLVLPANSKNAAGPPPWYDWALATLSAALFGWFAYQATRILSEGWEYNAPTLAKAISGVLWLIVMEGLRRTSGWPMTVVVAAVSLYPVVAESIPNPLKGSSQSLPDTLAFHFASAEVGLRHPDASFRRDRGRVHRIRSCAELHRRRALLQRPRLRPRRALPRRRGASRHHLVARSKARSPAA